MSGRPERVYFTDRDLGNRFGEILEAAGLTVERHADHFAAETADEVWLAEIGKRGWIALTHDRRSSPSGTTRANTHCAWTEVGAHKPVCGRPA